MSWRSTAFAPPMVAAWSMSAVLTVLMSRAATLPCAALTAWHALIESGHLKAGEVVLILGTGGVSCFGMQLARMHGAHVIVLSGSDAKLDRARSLGAGDLINYGRTPGWDKEVLKLTDGIGVDHVVEIGGAQTLEKSINATRPGGVGSREMFAAMNRAVSSAKLRPVIDRTFSFSDAKEAVAAMAKGEHFGKIVIAGV